MSQPQLVTLSPNPPGLRLRRAGYPAGAMQRETTLDDVRTFETRGGNVRYVVRDADGNEYTTFREQIGEQARRLAGKQARIEFHEQERGQYKNVYLDKVEPAAEERGEGSERDTDPEEAAWRTAVDAAPWLVGPEGDEVAPDDLYQKLKPFKDRVAEDIKQD
jgi:hypothetical protein